MNEFKPPDPAANDPGQPELLPGGKLSIGGFTPMSTTDFPGHIAAVVFCQGCGWSCSYCHSAHLRPRQYVGAASWPAVREYLRRRRGMLDAVVFSGGEPTLQFGLLEAVQESRALGFKVGLHTGGPYPSRLSVLLPHLDWVAMDVKADFENYESITGASSSGVKAMVSAMKILESGIDCEFRTTVHPDLISCEHLLTLAKCLAGMGVRNYVLQQFSPVDCASVKLAKAEVNDFIDEALCERIRPLFNSFSVRTAS
jgi:anaerobic ribonucleoside-triphosphate reductase activating protein